jgi:hypothetical protein
MYGAAASPSDRLSAGSACSANEWSDVSTGNAVMLQVKFYFTVRFLYHATFITHD